MFRLRAVLWGAWCTAVVAGLGCSHDYSALNKGSGGSAGGQAAGHPGAGGAGATGAGGALGAAGVGGAIGPGGQPGSGGAIGVAGAVGAGGAIGPGGQPGTGGAGGAGVAGQLGQGGTVGSGGQTGAGGSGTCQSPALAFTSPPSSVLIFTDRGGSSFDAPATVGGVPTTGSFFNVRAAVEDAIAGLQGQYRFGLGVFIGDHSTASCQLGYASAPIALNNAAAIGTVYDALGPSAYKADTPATAALAMANAALLADPGVGSKFLLFITNGATDFCDDGFADCPTDSVTAQLQAMYAGSPGIETFVVGLSTTSTGLTPGALPTFANAGAGQPAAFATSSGESQSDLYYECNSMSAWHALYATSGKTAAAPLGTYAATAGTAPLYKAATNATADVETQVKAALAAMKSCSFQLTAHSINPTKLAEGTVTVGGASVAQDASNGWSMPSSTVVTLNGAACSSYRTGAAVAVNFPCDAIVP